jgi:hypothetical protein
MTIEVTAMNENPGANHDEHFYFGTIKNISGARSSGLWQIYFEGGGFCHIESGFGLRVMSQAYGGLMHAIGKTIRYKTEGLNVMSYFEPVESLADDLFQV